jgi:hypothetical protein
LLGISLALVLAQAGTSTPTLEVRPSTANVSIGERFQVTVEARGPGGATYEFPKAVSSGSVELTESKVSTPKAGVAVYDAQVFGIGEEGKIPEIEVGYRSLDGSSGSLKSEPVPLNVISSLDPKEEKPAPADFAPPMPVVVAPAFWVVNGLAGLFLIAGMVWLARRLRFPKGAVDPTARPALSPEEEALRGLEQLALARATLEPRGFYIELVQILKQYLERRLEAPVLEMTSTEALAFLKAHAWTTSQAVPLRDLVTSADLVKFGGSSDASNGDRHLELVREVIARIDRLHQAELERRALEPDRRKIA